MGMTFNYCIYLAHSKGRRLPFSKANFFTFFRTSPRKHQHEKSINMKIFLDSIEMIENIGSQKNPTNENGIDTMLPTSNGVLGILLNIASCEHLEIYFPASSTGCGPGPLLRKSNDGQTRCYHNNSASPLYAGGPRGANHPT